MTAQEIFDKVLFSLRKQGKASTKLGKCMYRGPDGLKCAVGHLIEDKDYSTTMEGQRVHVLHLPARLESHLNLLSALQKAHDGVLAAGGRVAWEADMARIADRFNLVYKESTK